MFPLSTQLLDPGLSGASFPGLSSNSSSLSAFGSLSFDVAFAQDTLQLSRALSYVVLGTAADSSPTLLVEPGLLPDAQTTSASNHFLATQAQLPQPRPLYVVQEGTCAPVPTAAAIATPQAGRVLLLAPCRGRLGLTCRAALRRGLCLSEKW